MTTRFVLRSFRALLVLGVVFLLGAWVVGPSTSAAKIRAWWDQLLGRAGEAGAEREIGPVSRWVAAHQRALSIATVVVAVLALALWTRPTGWVVILLLLLLLLVVAVLLVVGAIRLVAEVARRADLETIDLSIDAVTLEEDEEVVEEEIGEPGYRGTGNDIDVPADQIITGHPDLTTALYRHFPDRLVAEGRSDCKATRRSSHRRWRWRAARYESRSRPFLPAGRVPRWFNHTGGKFSQ